MKKLDQAEAERTILIIAYCCVGILAISVLAFFVN